MSRKGGGPSFNKFRMSGWGAGYPGRQKAAIPRQNQGRTAIGFRFGPGVFFPLILSWLKDEGKEYPRPAPYRRVRRMVFLQVAVQVRLCRASYWYPVPCPLY